MKTPKSRRELKMCDTFFNAFKHIQAVKPKHSNFVFVSPTDLPPSTHFVSRKRKPLVHLSNAWAHNTRLLFDVYAPYVANASRLDGTLMKSEGLG
ncbi:hypothetical protein [Shewanella algicola]|uniref:Uncharacterized protein n=1 Tax=Shewanella algicola TaxID=640633 RepID=A0A9X1Z9B1_9GAMM|nr:hypothetical protein [Shewanella algicola]MCL1106469.1 hypothetical protein [Shewanella algicola]